MATRIKTVTGKAEFLGSLPLFKYLNEDELAALAQITTEYEYPDHSVVAYQRDAADRLFIVRQGRLHAYTLNDRGETVSERAYLPGAAFNDVWLLTPGKHPATVKAAGICRLLIIKSHDFLQLLEAYPSMLEGLEPDYGQEEEAEAPLAGVSEEAWKVVGGTAVNKPREKYRSSGLLPDELPVYESRRSGWLLLLKAGLPALLMFVVPLSCNLLLLPFMGVSRTGNIGLSLTLFAGFIFLLFFLFQLLDWQNDYFMITNKRAIHHEFSLRTFQATLSEAPLQQIQSVEIDKPSLLSNLLNFGTARITTGAAKQIILFDYIGDPAIVKDTINDLRQRVQELDAGRIQTTMRQSLERHFNIPNEFSTVAGETNEAPPPVKKKSSGFANWFRHAFSYRLEENGTITYRKHFFVMLAQIAIPLTFLIALLVIIIIVPQPSVRTILSFVMLFDFGWLVWQLEDWRNDTFQVTDRFVIDIDRRPFGFSESRKQAELANIQNATSSKPGLLAVLFNYGSVIIDTAGAKADIVFENVANPNRVKSDIFQRQETFRQRQRDGEAQRRQQEYGVLLDVYQQAMEQGRIPKRTPPR